MSKIGGWYETPEAQENEFAALVANIVSAKLAGNYENIKAEVIGGWNISTQDQMTMKAEVIADAVVAGMEEA
jgi:hypothetical protein